MKPKIVLITGVTSGIGFALMKHFLDKNYFVVGVGRDKNRLDNVASVFKDISHSFELCLADFSQLKDIEQLILHVKSKYHEGIDVLINNAAIVPKPKRITNDGFEMQFQVNHLAVVKLSYGLLDLLSKKQGIIITTASNAHKFASYNPIDIQNIKKYSSVKSYGKTKLYNVYFTDTFNELSSQKSNVIAYAVHPGLVKTEIGTKDTSKLYAWLWKKFTKRGITPEQAVQTYDYLVHLDSHEKAENYYYQSKPESKSKVARNHSYRKDLMRQTYALLNIEA